MAQLKAESTVGGKRIADETDLENAPKMFYGLDEPDLTPEELTKGGQFWLKKVIE